MGPIGAYGITGFKGERGLKGISLYTDAVVVFIPHMLILLYNVCVIHTLRL